MKLGLLADIHGDVQNLRSAIRLLNHEQVDRFILLGDVIYSANHAAETVELLQACRAAGVWGNHELGLCVEPDDVLRKAYTEPVVEFFATLCPRLEFGDVLISHTLPSQDPADPVAYYLGRPLSEEGALDESFAGFTHRVMFTGHFHRWFAATPEGPLDWNGSRPLKLNPADRYLIVIDAVMNGAAAVFDTGNSVLTPIRVE